MKTLLLYSILFFGGTTYSQNEVRKSDYKENDHSIEIPINPETDEKKEKISMNNTTDVIQKPQFPGGTERLLAFLKNNFIVPNELIENSTIGWVFLSFIVEKDGSLSDIKVVRDLGFGTGAEAVRVVSKMPKWIPGKVNDKPIAERFNLPIRINEKK